MIKKKKPKRKKYPYAGYNFAAKAERNFAINLDAHKIWWMYEPEKIEWWPPPLKAKVYTPDFKIKKKNGDYFFVEFKGFFRKGNKRKMRAVKQQHPNLDIRFVFMDASKPTGTHVRKNGTKMTHGEWADRYGFPWAQGFIPKAWMEE